VVVKNIECGLLDYDTVKSCPYLTLCLRDLLPSSVGQNFSTLKKGTAGSCKTLLIVSRIPAWCTLSTCMCLFNKTSRHEDVLGSVGIAPPPLTSTLVGGE
jgi:hypothetical protein